MDISHNLYLFAIVPKNAGAGFLAIIGRPSECPLPGAHQDALHRPLVDYHALIIQRQYKVLQFAMRAAIAAKYVEPPLLPPSARSFGREHELKRDHPGRACSIHNGTVLSLP
jgi:hypothetical protein